MVYFVPPLSTEMLRNDPASFDKPIKKNNLLLFSKKNAKSERTKPLQETKDQLHLFSQLYVATQVRGGDMDEFFNHETLAHPPSLSKYGQLRSGEIEKFGTQHTTYG